MALQKITIPLSMQKGVDTKRDIKQLVFGTLRKAQNALFSTIGMIKKRKGYDKIDLRDGNGNQISNTKAVFQFKNELGVVSDNQYWGRSDSTETVDSRGSLYSTKVSHIPVLSNGSNHTNLDFTLVNNVKAICFIDSATKNLYYSLQDTSNDSLLVNNSLVASNVDNCKIASIGSIVHIVYVVGPNLYFKTFNINSPDVLSSAILTATNVSSVPSDPALYFPVMDVISDGTKIFVAYNGDGLSIFNISSGNAVSSISVVNTTTYRPNGAISLLLSNSNQLVIFFSNNNYTENVEIYYTAFSYDLSTVTVAPTLIKNMGVAAPDVPAIDAYDNGSTYVVKYHVKHNTNDQNSYIESTTCSYTGVVGSFSVFMRSVGLASRGFFWNSQWYSVVNYASELQGTLFIVDESANIVAKIQPGTSGGHVLQGSLPKSAVDQNFVWLIMQVKGVNVSEEGNFYSLLGVSSIKLDFNNQNAYQNAQVGHNLHIAGGVLQMYDGGSAVEHGFHVYPETISEGTISDVPTQGELAPGNYGYKAVYSWFDNFGQQHRSVPSDVLNVERTSGVKATMDVALTPSFAGTDDEFTLTYNLNGNAYYGSNVLQALPEVTIQILPPANNPTNTVLALIDGAALTINLTITPNTGLNNSFIPVTLTTKQVVELINTGAVVGKNVTLTNVNKSFANITASGGGNSELPTNVTTVDNFSGAKGKLAGGLISGASGVAIWGRTAGNSQEGTIVSLKVNPAAANPGGAILVNVTGVPTNILITLTPDTTNGTLTAQRLSDVINNKAYVHPPRTVTLTDSSNLLQYIWAGGFNNGNIVSGGSYDGYVKLSGSAAITSQPISVPTLRLTQKSNAIVELYRTENDGSVFYKCSSITSPTVNDKTVDSVTVTDSLSDEDLISREVLYTTGGVLENTGAPTCHILAQHTASNRLIIVGEDPNTLIYSKIRNPGFPVEFNDSLSKSIDPVGGNITAVISMDEKLIIFEQSAILYISGQGPNNLGLQDTFTEPERISVDVGCEETKSIVLTPDGIMFKSKKGIFLLNRGLGLSYIGAEVEQYNGLYITSAKIISHRNQVIFTTSSPTCLVYDYQEKQWSTYDNHQALDAGVVNGDYYYVRNNHDLLKESSSGYSDDGSPIKLLVDTGWISFAGLQNFMRVYHMLLLADYKSPHQLRVRIAYDFNEAWVQETLIDPSDFMTTSTYGEDSPYGNPTTQGYGGSSGVYQARVNFTIQKCQSVRISIEDVQTVVGEGLSISAINFVVGIKPTSAKLAESRKYSTS